MTMDKIVNGNKSYCNYIQHAKNVLNYIASRGMA